MTEDIVRTFLKHNKLSVIEGEIVNDSIFMPFLLMDLAYDIYSKKVKPFKVKHKMNFWKKEWLRWYNKFNARFFEAFDVAQRDEIMDKMDYLCDYVKEEVQALEDAIMNCMEDVNESEKRICGTLLMLNIVTQAAHTFWNLTYKDRVGFLVPRYLEKMQEASFHLINLIYTGTCFIDCNTSTETSAASDRLCKRVVHWALVDCNKQEEYTS